MKSRDRFFVFGAFEPLVQERDVTEAELQKVPDIGSVGLEGGPVHPEVASAIQQARGGGKVLEGTLKEQMSVCLGYNFSEVRIHTGLYADRLNRRIGARAFTIGSDIFFTQGAYDPTSLSGRELIAHELVHVMQQHSGRVIGEVSGMTVRPADDPLEQEADALSRRAAASMGCPQAARYGINSPDHTLFRPEGRPQVIQRDLQRLRQAARNEINRLTDESDKLKPKNCHEAVLGWFLTSMNYPRRWSLIRKAAEKFAPTHAGGGNKYFDGYWMWYKIYTEHIPLDFDNVGILSDEGDILVVGNLAAHSMVVVDKSPIYPNIHVPNHGWQTHHVYIRGFNNSGTFSQLLPAPYPPQGMKYDNNDREVTDSRVWGAIAGGVGFGQFNAPLYKVRHQYARIKIADLFPWEGSEIPMHTSPRWHYNPIQGWTYY
jgi:Domain of unknown function (DUF4157)